MKQTIRHDSLETRRCFVSIFHLVNQMDDCAFSIWQAYSPADCLRMDGRLLDLSYHKKARPVAKGKVSQKAQQLLARVLRLELALQLNEVLAMHQILDKILMLPFLALTMRQIFYDPVAMEQLDDLRQTILETFLRLFCFYFSHGALHPQRSAPGDQSFKN